MATLFKPIFPRIASLYVIHPIGNINENYCGLKIMINVTSILYHHNFKKLCFFRFSMADGAHEITRSLREVFGLDEEQTRRLMCWSHKY